MAVQTAYNFNKAINTDQLTWEIEQSAIITALAHITTEDLAVEIVFKDVLSEGDETILNALVTAHVPKPPMPQVSEVVVRENAAFATPAYRTKWHATAAEVTVAAGTVENIDFQMMQELYVYGGSLMYDNAQWGDYVEAQIVDKDSLIPEPYRASMCENWPIVAAYVIKAWINPKLPQLEINTYPLNAKVTAGLYLRVKYHAVADPEGQPEPSADRRMFVNYFMSKKLT